MGLPVYPSGAIISEGKNTLELGRQYQANLERFGIDDAYLERFREAICQAEALPDDQYHKIQIRSATSHKNELRDECIDYAIEFRNRIELGFGRTSPQYRVFPGEQLKKAKSSDGIMMDLMENILRLSDDYREALEPFGLTRAVIREGEELLQEFREADLDQELKKVERPAATVERDEAFQLVYDMTNAIRATGRLVFKNSPVEYNLFRSPWGRYRRGSSDVSPEAEALEDQEVFEEEEEHEESAA